MWTYQVFQRWQQRNTRKMQLQPCGNSLTPSTRVIHRSISCHRCSHRFPHKVWAQWEGGLPDKVRCRVTYTHTCLFRGRARRTESKKQPAGLYNTVKYFSAEGFLHSLNVIPTITSHKLFMWYYVRCEMQQNEVQSSSRGSVATRNYGRCLRRSKTRGEQREGVLADNFLKM